MILSRRLLLAAPLLPLAARAQAETTLRLRGIIAAASDGSLSLVLAPDAAISSRRRVALSEIRPGDYLGITAEPGPEDRLRAVEVVIFPEAMRGVGEGHRPFDLTPSSTMTNATVESAVMAAEGRVLTMAFGGRQLPIEVPPGASVVTPVPAAREDLKPGAQVLITAQRDAQGQLTARRITVSKDGVMLPM
ncbi:hypothetical protein NON00_20795 [Roseomonas sp. GC11]|uniref:hypothetical protein n=1 Tax=Roseomonas sp. GC11 TaxID=2950546 RepID=UPI00210C1E95|nr:hypothetical protein [Roseomonas sp. GC11]MCQ4162354.1 hypothetical protein [Roseomonas sp. GC11]